MMVKSFRLLVVFLLLQSSLIAAEVPKKPLILAVLPCTDILETFKKFHPLVQFLTQETGVNLQLVVPENLTRFEVSIHNGEIDLALQDPHTFLKLENSFDQESLLRALNAEGGTTQTGAVIVRKDSGIKKLSELKGKTVMFGPKISANKWLAARLLFKENGIDIDQDLKTYLNGGCCEDIAFNVYLKAVDAGVVCDHFGNEHGNKQKEMGIEADQLVVIGMTQKVPMKIMGARKGVDKEIIARIKQALLKLDRTTPEHEAILLPTELGGFCQYQDGDFTQVKAMMKGNWAE
uniref:Phosphate/phosphite/phosphonate ABC transporter substrate-binding protein n=1 Tax=Desulfobacca acetoxidans TaxID=60893 RepID=A0A7C3Z2G2_9BACT